MSDFVGSAKVKINGTLCKTVPDSVEVTFGGLMRTSQMADGTFNVQETQVPGELTVEFLWTDKFPFKTVNELKNGLVEIETNINTSYQITEACRIGDPLSASSKDGRVKAKFAGTIILK